MIAIPRENLFDAGAARFLIEASDLGLPAGVFPVELTTIPPVGNGLTFKPLGVQPDGAHVYLQQFGVIRIAILND